MGAKENQQQGQGKGNKETSGKKKTSEVPDFKKQNDKWGFCLLLKNQRHMVIREITD